MEAPTTNPLCEFLSNYLLLIVKRKGGWVTAGRNIIHNFKRYFFVKTVKSSKPGADGGKFMVPHSQLNVYSVEKKVRNKIKQRKGCLSWLSSL